MKVENNESRLWMLLAKKMAGEASDAELVELGTMLSHPDAPLVQEELLDKFWKEPLENTVPAGLDVDKNWDSLSQCVFPEKSHLYVTTMGEDTKPNRRRKQVWLYAAASILLLVVSAMGIQYLNSVPSSSTGASASNLPNQVTSRYGSKTSVILPEGTKVWLNAGSNIYYGNDFISKREVYLVGEAYFDVTHDAKKPFIIHAANVNIKVLGTAFNVKAYPEADQVETALIRGSVEVSTNADPERKILLRPNEKIAIRKVVKEPGLPTAMASAPSAIIKEELYSITRMQVNQKDSTVDETAWMQEKLIFNGETFGHLAVQMERWYGVVFAFQNETLTKIKFSGVFDNQNIVEALDALAYSSNFKFSYHINKNLVIIQPK